MALFLYYTITIASAVFLIGIVVYDTFHTDSNYTDENYRPYDWELDGE